MPSLTQLQYIVTVEKLRHFGLAAKACHISQPTLSMQIQKAEEELGLIIFDRDKKPILPTDKGAKVIAQAKIVVFEHEKLLQVSKEASGEVSGDFRLGIIPTLAPYLVPGFIQPFSEKFPKVSLTIDELKTEDIITSLREQSLDAAILATPLHEKGLRERVLFYEPFYLYVDSKHELASRKKIQKSDLNANEIWLLQDGHCFRNQVINFCSAKKTKGSFSENVKFQSGNFETLRNLVKNNGGYTLFPHLYVSGLNKAEQAGNVRFFFEPIPMREVSLVHFRNQLKVDITTAIEEVLRKSLPKELQQDSSQKMKILDI